MNLKTRKVAIVGAGLVGSSCGYSIVNQGICDELLMIDINEEKALGEVMDLDHCIDFVNSRTKVALGSYEDCSDADVVIITAGGAPKPGQTRLDTLGASARVARDVVAGVMKSGFNGIFLVASNPVDIITYLVWKESGLPRNQVLGTGTSIDSSRLKTAVSELLDVDPRSVNGFALGEHGDSQFVAWSHMTVGGKPFLQVLEDHKERLGEVDLDAIAKKVRKAGWAIHSRKGTTYYGIGCALAHITRAILNDSYSIIPVSVVLQGEYGYEDICTGVPCVISRKGIEDVVELHLTQDERQKLAASNQVLKQYMAEVGY